MILRATVLAMTMCMGHAAHAFDAWLTAGLEIVSEHMPETVAVDGVAFTIRRATGADVPELAKRIESQWRSAGSEVRPLRHAGWTVRTRMQGSYSEVLQWRPTNREHELLWSTLRTEAALTPVPEASLGLPAQCAWGRSVHGTSAGRSFLERSAHCRISADALKANLKASLPAQGWRIRSEKGSGLTLGRPGAEGFLSFTPMPGGAGAWLIWLRVDGPSAAP
jgi:hypothetical protein